MNKQDLVQDLIKNNVQYGHKTSRYHPDMAAYIWGARNGMHLIDLNKTAFMLQHACDQIRKVMELGGQILWVGTKRQAQKSILKAAQSLNHPYVIHRWIGGTLTNSDQVKKAVTKLLHMRDAIEKPLPHMKKKQLSMLSKELERLEKNVSGVVRLKPMPSILVVVDVKREMTSIKEAKKCGIPVLALVDTNSSTELVDTIIPANDDSPKSISFVLECLSEAAQEGFEVFKKNNPNFEKEQQERSPRQHGQGFHDNRKRFANNNSSVDSKAPATQASAADVNPEAESKISKSIATGQRRGTPLSSGSRKPGSKGGSSRPMSKTTKK